MGFGVWGLGLWVLGFGVWLRGGEAGGWRDPKKPSLVHSWDSNKNLNFSY